VQGDGDRLKQVVLNLLSNAIKFTPGLKAGGEVEVRTEVGTGTPRQGYICAQEQGVEIGVMTWRALFVSPYT
jgi:signal transduction histidine kinase